MAKGNWFRRGLRRVNGEQRSRSAARRKSWLASAAGRCSLSFETLEERRVLTTFLVTNLADLSNGAVTFGSLRWAVNQANADPTTRDEIVFSDAAFSFGSLNINTIALNGGQLTLSGPVSILGPSADKLTVQQTTSDSRVFMVDNGDDDVAIGIEISGLTIAGGGIVGNDDSDKGGGVYTKEALTMNEVVVNFNSASRGGDGIYVERGSLRLNRSFVDLNSGDGLLMGGDDDEMRPFVTVVNSTFAHHDVAIFNTKGRLNVENSTITANNVGVRSQGNPVPEEDGGDPPPAVVFTDIYSSIVYGNEDADIERVGQTAEEEPRELLPSITSSGFNIYETGNVADPSTEDGMIFANPDDFPGVDPMLEPNHGYAGGSTQVYLLDPMSPAIDMGDPDYSGDEFEQRGRHFARVYDYTLTGVPRSDIGAVEMQSVTFVVDTLLDEVDNIYSGIYTLEFVAGEPDFTIGDYETQGDFSLREAMEFARLNPGPDIITFTQDFITAQILEDEDPDGGPPTIRLIDGPLVVGTDLTIQGPENFVLEIDASGNDLSPTEDNSTGTRVFVFDDLDPANFLNISLSSLTLKGADFGGSGGAIFSRENLTVRNMTFKDNHASVDGAAIYASSGSLTVQGSTFNDNIARRDGGAIYVNANVTARISNSTFSDNRASARGGAIANNNGALLVEYSTITLNTASTNLGHGIVNIGGSAATRVRSTVIANNGNNTSDVAATAGAVAASFTSLGYNFVGKGNALSRFNNNDITNNTNPMLGQLFNSGGIVETHQPLVGSPLIDANPTTVPQLITPTSVVSSTDATDASDAQHLIDDSGLPPGVTYENYQSALHDLDALTNTWRTEADPPDYFEDPAKLNPELIFTLDQQYALTDMVVWGFPRQPENGSEAKWFLIEFSIDGGATYYQSVRVEHALTSQASETLNLGGVYWADAVRVSVFDNFFDDVPVGGDAVALGEVKFLTNRYDQRGVGFDRIFDGDGNGSKRIDIGAYELQGLSLIVSNFADENDGNYSYGNFSLREAIALANVNPLPDVITFDPFLLLFLDFQNPQDPTLLLGGALTPGTPSDMRITDHLTIDGPGLGMLAIDGSGLDNPSATINGSRIFTIDDGLANQQIDVTIRGLEFRNAVAPTVGGAISSRENLTLEGVRFSNNRTDLDPVVVTDPPGLNLHGGAVYQEGGALEILDSEFTNNRTFGLDSDGGALYVLNGALTVSNTFFNGNLTTLNNSDGGAIALKNSSFVSHGNFISGNQVGHSGLGRGGGLFSDASDVTLVDTFVTGNSTLGGSAHGGGLAAISSTLVISNSAINDNQTNGSQANGGGLWVNGGTTTVDGSQFVGNSTAGQQASGAGVAINTGTVTISTSTIATNLATGVNSHGAGVWNNGGVLNLRNSTISANQATNSQSRGGGIYSDTALSGSPKTLILNSTVSGNSAGLRGGGVYNADGRVEIKHSTITNNAVSTINTGAGVASFGNSATTLTSVQSSIIAGNVGVAGGTRTDVDYVDSNFNNTFQSLGYNLIGTGNALGAFNSNDLKNVANPGLAPLGDNGSAGGMFSLETHALVAGSPAINAGNPSFNPNSFSPPLTTDQAGNVRVVSRIDIGSMESDVVPGLPADFDGDNDVDGSDFLSWQRNLGQSNATKAQGDADGNGLVNGQDLAAWRSGFGSTGGSSASFSVVGSTAALIATDEAVSEEVASSGDSSSSVSNGFASLASLGTPLTTSATMRSLDDSVESAPQYAASSAPSTAVLWEAAEGLSPLKVDFSFDERLLEAGADGEAEDLAFADWDEGLLF